MHWQSTHTRSEEDYGDEVDRSEDDDEDTVIIRSSSLKVGKIYIAL